MAAAGCRPFCDGPVVVDSLNTGAICPARLTQSVARARRVHQSRINPRRAGIAPGVDHALAAIIPTNG
jgi:hypothetical protein